MIANNRSRDLYFKALAEEQKKIDGRGEEIQKDCLICQEPIEKGMITYCGHTSCVDCGLHWFKESRRCHTCNSQVKPNEWYNVCTSPFFLFLMFQKRKNLLLFF